MEKHYSLSVALALENRLPRFDKFLAGGLILVVKQTTELIGLIAGHMDHEKPLPAVLRELEEETRMTSADIKLKPRYYAQVVPQATKTSVGFLYTGETIREIPQQGYDPHSPEIARVKPFSFDEILTLIRYPDRLYKPEFNVPFLSKIAMDYIAVQSYLETIESQKRIGKSLGIPEEWVEEYG